VAGAIDTSVYAFIERSKWRKRVGVESAFKRKQKYLQSTDGTQSIRKAMIVRIK
jgi:hypothetical protein